MIVRLQTADFDPEQEAQALKVRGAGARVSFVGTVRDLSGNETVKALDIEHYPEMTQAEIERIAVAAQARHRLLDVLVIHRYGHIPCDQRIVLVTVWATHRGDAFAGCQEIIDLLKTRAPFWKKELTPTGGHWVPGHSTEV